MIIHLSRWNYYYNIVCSTVCVGGVEKSNNITQNVSFAIVIITRRHFIVILLLLLYGPCRDTNTDNNINNNDSPLWKCYKMLLMISFPFRIIYIIILRYVMTTARYSIFSANGFSRIFSVLTARGNWLRRRAHKVLFFIFCQNSELYSRRTRPCRHVMLVPRTKRFFFLFRIDWRSLRSPLFFPVVFVIAARKTH